MGRRLFERVLAGSHQREASLQRREQRKRLGPERAVVEPAICRTIQHELLRLGLWDGDRRRARRRSRGEQLLPEIGHGIAYFQQVERRAQHDLPRFERTRCERPELREVEPRTIGGIEELDEAPLEPRHVSTERVVRQALLARDMLGEVTAELPERPAARTVSFEIALDQLFPFRLPEDAPDPWEILDQRRR